jgi:hypothetical protein
MTTKQLQFYRVLWSQAKRMLVAHGMSSREAEEERHAIHRRTLGYDKSSKELTNEEFDQVKGAFLAISKPGDMKAQLAQAAMPKTRRLVTLRHYLAAIGRPDEYAEAIAATMNRKGRIGQPWEADRAYVRGAKTKRAPRGEKVFFDYAHTQGGEPTRRDLTLDDLTADELEKLIVAIKREAKREWPTKELLLAHLNELCAAEGFDARAAMPAIRAALNMPEGAILYPDGMDYERLLVVLSALKSVGGPGERPEAAEAEAVDSADPDWTV